VIIAHLLIKANIADKIEPVFSGLMPAIAVMILISAYRLGKKVWWTKQNKVIFGLAAVLLIVVGVHPILVIVGGIAIGLFFNRAFQPFDSAPAVVSTAESHDGVLGAEDRGDRK
jgi:chromate transport protein ChrA